MATSSNRIMKFSASLFDVDRGRSAFARAFEQ
jgi:hypothetical protein